MAEIIDSNAAANPLITKLRKVIDSNLENDEDLIEGLKSLSDFFPENTLYTRRNLRSQIEQRSLETHKLFFNEFNELKKQLDTMDSMVTEINSSCLGMKERLNKVKSQTQDLIQQTTHLRSESQKVEMKARIADAMLSAFQLTSVEVEALSPDSNKPLTEDFFRAIQKVKEINERSHLIIRSRNQTVGLEIMDNMSYHMETAYERLYRWAHNECRTHTQESPEISALLCQAFQCLQERPILFKYVLDEYCTARRNTLVRCFIDALTCGTGSDAMSHSTDKKPIDLLSHDSLRYVGDMLAWLHQGVASERELIQTLLKKCDNLTFCSPLPEILNGITEGVCRMFKNRIEQVLLSEKETIHIYRLNNLLQFYKTTLGQLLSEESALFGTLDEAQKLAWQLFLLSLKNSMQSSIAKPETPSSDLSPPAIIKNTLSLLETILTSQDVSMATLVVRKAEFIEVLNALVDSLVQYCNLSATSLSAVDAAAYLVNCLYLLQNGLSRLEYTENKIQTIQSHLDAHADTLISEQAGLVLHVVGLAGIYGYLQEGFDVAKDGALIKSQRSGVNTNSLKESCVALDKYLSAPDDVCLPQLNTLLSAKLRDLVRRRAADLVHTAYNGVYNAVRQPENGFPDSLIHLMRSPDEVGKLILN